MFASGNLATAIVISLAITLVVTGCGSRSASISAVPKAKVSIEKKNVTQRIKTEFVDDGTPITKELRLTLAANKFIGIGGSIIRKAEQRQLEQHQTITAFDQRKIWSLRGTSMSGHWYRGSTSNQAIPTGRTRSRLIDLAYTGPLAVTASLAAPGVKKKLSFTRNIPLHEKKGTFRIPLDDLAQRFGRMPHQATIFVSVEDGGQKRTAKIVLKRSDIQQIIAGQKEMALKERIAAEERKLQRKIERAELEAEEEQERQEQQITRAEQEMRRRQHASSNSSGNGSEWVNTAVNAINKAGDEYLAAQRRRSANMRQNWQRRAAYNRQQQQRRIAQKRSVLEESNQRRRRQLASQRVEANERIRQLRKRQAEQLKRLRTQSKSSFNVAATGKSTNPTQPVASAQNSLQKKRPKRKQATSWVPEAVAVCWSKGRGSWECDGPGQQSTDKGFEKAASLVGCKSIRRKQPFRGLGKSRKGTVLLFCGYGAGARAISFHRDIAAKYGFSSEIADTRMAYLCQGTGQTHCAKHKALKVARYSQARF